MFLCATSWKWVKKAIFNWNSLKILIATLVILGLSFALRNPMYKLGLLIGGNSHATAMITELVGVVLIDAVIYIALLIILKEDLISSFFRKKEVVNEK